MQKGVVRKRPPKRNPSEYGRQLQEKQGLKKEYNLRERPFKRYVLRALTEGKKGSAPEMLMRQLEQRLDSVVYRMGIAATRRQARQMVSHGHVCVNGRPVDIPSYQVRSEEVVSVHPSSRTSPLFEQAAIGLKKYEAPQWMRLDKEKVQAQIVGEPTLEEISPGSELSLIFEFYSR